MTAYTVHKIASTTQIQYFTETLKGLGNPLPLDMVLVPGGSFKMGSPDDEPEREEREGPQRTVTLPSFFISRYLVTQAQWQAVSKLEKVDVEIDPAPSKFKGANRPVEQVSWDEATEFCKRLHKQVKRPYRLPSEAEWEYACRAGTATPFAFGKTLTTEIANYRSDYTYNNGPRGEYRQETTAVNTLGVANAFGLYDMHGNVLEWCSDPWHNNYEGAPTDGSDWLTDDKEASFVLRGGSWEDFPWNCRSATRCYFMPDVRDYRIGFRISCPAPKTLEFTTS